MTQPAWPSTSWQILSSDYDTQASFYGVKKACEPIHVQLDLTNYEVDAVNTTNAALGSAILSAKVYSLTNELLLDKQQQVQLTADTLTPAFKLDLAPLLAKGVALVRLTLTDAGNKPLSDNIYWLGADSYSYRELTKLPIAPITATATSTKSGDMVHLHVHLHNNSNAAALQAKLTLENAADSTRVLPAYYSDNYFSLLPQEDRDITIDYPSKSANGPAKLALAGWNITPTTIPVTGQ